mgnify:CR=1 FL=1
MAIYKAFYSDKTNINRRIYPEKVGIIKIEDKYMGDNERNLAILGGALAIGGLAAFYILGGPKKEATIGQVSLAVHGSLINLDVQFKNTGNTDWTIGVGASLLDSAGQWWDMWTGNMQPAGLSTNRMDSNFAAKGATVTHRIANVPINSGVAIGPALIRVRLWKEWFNPVPPSLDSKDFPNIITIEAPVAVSASIISLTVA